MNSGIPSRLAWAAMAAGLALGAVACDSASLDKAGGPVSKSVVLTLADAASDTTNAQPFANAVNELSHGSLQIKIEGNWRPNDPSFEVHLIKDVQAGKAQLGLTPSRAFDNIGIDNFQALQAPFLIDNYPLEQKVLSSSIARQMLAGLRTHGMVGLAVLPGPLRRPLGFTRPLVGATSYLGARIAIRPSQLDTNMFSVLGATTVTYYRTTGPGNITGLTGMENYAEGADSGAAVPNAVLTGNVVFAPLPNVLFMNSQAFGSLTSSQRSVLSRAAAGALKAGVYQGNDTAAVANLCRRGITIASASPADLADLQTAVQPIYQELRGNPSTRTFISQITAMRQVVGGAPAAITCPAATGNGTATGTATDTAALQGTWQASYTENELIAAGDSTSIPGEGNWGDFTLTFHGNQFSSLLTGGDPGVTPDNVLWSGTFILIGNTITFYQVSKNYVGSDTQILGPYFWSVYQDSLTFKKDGWAGNINGPTGLVVKPWRKTGP